MKYICITLINLINLIILIILFIKGNISIFYTVFISIGIIGTILINYNKIWGKILININIIFMLFGAIAISMFLISRGYGFYYFFPQLIIMSFICFFIMHFIDKSYN